MCIQLHVNFRVLLTVIEFVVISTSTGCPSLLVQNPAMQEMQEKWVQFLGGEDTLEEEIGKLPEK